jgi:hypothetical protein
VLVLASACHSAGGIGGGGMFVGEDSPLFGGGGIGVGGHGLGRAPPGVPPGARFDPYGPDVGGIEGGFGDEDGRRVLYTCGYFVHLA